MGIKDNRQSVADEVSIVAEGLSTALEHSGKGTISEGVTKGHNSHHAVLNGG